MNKVKRSLYILLMLTLLLTLCACGGTKAEPEKPVRETPAATPAETTREPTPEPVVTEQEANAGEYTFLCARFSAAYMDRMYELGGAGSDLPDQYVAMPDMVGETVTLEADGSGYLYWGDNNQGPIDWWKMDGDALQFQAGVAVIDGTIADGLMTLTIDDGFSALFAAPGADTSGVEPITLGEFASMLRGPEPAASVPAELPVEGEYELFAVEYEGALVYSADLGVSSTLTLADGGTGRMTSDNETMDITVWTLEGEALTITLADGDSAGGKLHGGVIELDIYGTGYMIFFYAKEGADLSGYAPMTMEEYQSKPESLLYALWAGLDLNAGIHLNYDMHTDYMDADQSYDVHGKDGVYYSRRTTRVSGFENTVVTFFRDGTAYNLYPDDMTGIIATTTTSSYIAENIMLMDHLLSDIRGYALRKDYTTQTQEIEGVSYTVELFPETDSTAQAAFYFRDDGRLVYCLKGAPVVETVAEIGETVYTVYTIDDAVNEALFDISGYTIK